MTKYEIVAALTQATVFILLSPVRFLMCIFARLHEVYSNYRSHGDPA